MRHMPMGKLSVEGRAGSRAGQHVLRLSGTVTLETVPLFKEAVQAVSVPALIVDLTGVPYIDSAALGAFVQTYVACRKTGRKLALVGLSQRVQSLMKITSLESLFTTYPTLSEAEEKLV
jgi:anti-sigma B factor antagonist